MRKLHHADIPTIATIIIIAICVGYFGYYLVMAAHWLPYPNQIDFGEGMSMYVSKLWAEGSWDWNISTEPYITLMHGITLPVFMEPLINTFGWSLNMGRAIMFVSTLLISIILFITAKKLTKSNIFGIVAALLPFAHPTLRDWSLMARPDMLAALFSVAGVSVAILNKKNKWFYASIPLFILAALTKLTTLAGVGGVVFYLLLTDRKRFTIYTGYFLGLMSLSFGLINIATGGGLFNHLITYNQTIPFIWDWFTITNNWAIVLYPSVIMVLLSSVYMAIKVNRDRKIDIPIAYFLVATGVALVTSLREGSFINYFIEFIFASSLCVALALPMLRKIEIDKYPIRDGKVGLAGMLVMLVVVQLLTLNIGNAFVMPNDQYDEQVKEVNLIIADTNEPIPTENAGLVLNAGKVPLLEPFVYTNLKELGYWDDTQYINDYKSQRFDFIILRIPLDTRLEGDGHFTKEAVTAINENYTLVYHPAPNYYWYGLCVYEANRRL